MLLLIVETLSKEIIKSVKKIMEKKFQKKILIEKKILTILMEQLRK